MLIGGAVKEKIARLISNVAQAPLLAIPTFALVNYFSLDIGRFLLITALCVLFASILPALVILLWSRKSGSEIDIPQKEERTVPLLVVVAIYLAGAAALYTFGAPLLTTILMFCYFSNTLIVLFINAFWKISIHSMGVAGPTTALIFAFGLPGALPALLLPPVMWSRLYLKRHTVGQVFMGALLGFVLTAAQILLLSGLNG